MLYENASKESLETIMENECADNSLTSMRFKRLFNELQKANHEINRLTRIIDDVPDYSCGCIRNAWPLD